MRPIRVHRRGFTLLEVVIALAIGALALAIAASLLSAASDHAVRVHDRAVSMDREAATERTLRRFVGQMEWSRGADQPAGGDSTMVRFTSWCDVPAGWQERCSVELSLPTRDHASAGIVARLSTGRAAVSPP